MKTFLKIFAFLAVVFVGVGLILDNNIEVTREIQIKASPNEIHPYLEDLQQWPKWSPWLELDPSMTTSIGKITSGIGASQTWEGESGSGGLVLTESDSSQGIAYDLTFDSDPTVYKAGIRYAKKGDFTQVTWYMTGEMGPIIIGNYFAQLMDVLVGDSFTIGLGKLKKVVESGT